MKVRAIYTPQIVFARIWYRLRVISWLRWSLRRWDAMKTLWSLGYTMVSPLVAFMEDQVKEATLVILLS